MRVLVLPNAYVTANQGDYPNMELAEALETRFDTDAHMALYEGPQRLLKTDSEGVKVSVTLLDYDLPDHKTARVTEDLITVIEAVYPKPTHYYLTRGGARLVYEHGPVDPHEAQALHQQLVDRLAMQGLDCDPNVWQWCRIFRLPRVNRDGEDLDLHLSVGSGKELDLGNFDLSAAPRSYQVPVRKDPCPDPNQASEVVWEASRSGLKLTGWAREAKRILRFRMDGELEKCFQNPAPPIPDPRNPTIMGMAGSLARMLCNHTDFACTPENAFGIMAPRILQSMRPTDGNRNLLAETWKMILYCWSKEEGLKQHHEEESTSFTESMLDATGAVNKEELLSRLVVRPARGVYYVLTEKGHYSPIPHARDTLCTALKQAGLVGPEKLTTLTVATNRGVRDMTVQEVLNSHTLCLPEEIRRTPGSPPDEGRIDEDGYLHFGAYDRANLTPAFNPDVDRWLKLLFGKQYPLIERWVGLALAFDRGPICALSITGPPGTGKGMFVQGLVEATAPPQKVDARHVFGRWQYGLDCTPWIVADEGLPQSKNLANTFRQLVGGGHFQSERKFAHPTNNYVTPRIILTANNRETVEQLFTVPGLTESDVDAVAQRLFHVDCDDKAAKWLTEMGDYDFTEGWICGDNVVARHFLFLYEQHKDTPKMGRFLMQDLTDPALVAWLTIKNPHVSVMAEACLRLFQAERDDDGWVTIQQVADALVDFSITRQEYPLSVIGRHMRMLTEEKDEERRRKVDIQKLSFYARESGRQVRPGVHA